MAWELVKKTGTRGDPLAEDAVRISNKTVLFGMKWRNKFKGYWGMEIYFDTKNKNLVGFKPSKDRWKAYSTGRLRSGIKFVGVRSRVATRMREIGRRSFIGKFKDGMVVIDLNDKEEETYS